MSSSDSITSFAALSAQLAQAFADRGAIFATAGVDEPTWAARVDHWSARMEADASGELARRFGEAYAAAQAAPEPAPAADPRSLGSPAQPRRDEAPIAALEPIEEAPPLLRSRGAPIDLGGTQEVPVLRGSSALPFAPANAGQGSTSVLERRPWEALPPPLPSRPRAGDEASTEATQACPIYRDGGNVLPFLGPPAPRPAPSGSSSSPARRLHRFDPQTGEPLSEAIWVELPSSLTSRP